MGLNEHLSALVEETVAPFPDVTKRRMFGCDAFFARGAIFSLIWKDGRIGVKLTEPKDFATLMAEPGAEPWSPGGKMKMSGWVLAPESMHDDTDALEKWLVRAHAQAMSAPPKKKKPAARKKPTAKTKKLTKK